MNMQDLLLLWSDQPGVSVLVWTIILISTMYLAREPMHGLIKSMIFGLRHGSRMAMIGLNRLADRLTERNKMILLHHGQQALEKVIEREFHRINDLVARDLGSYPALHRKISDAISRIEEDYQHATDTPPPPPSWLSAIETVASIPRDQGSSVSRILDDIQKTIEKSHKETLDQYRKTSLKRHGLLGGMLPVWRTVSQGLEQAQSNITNLEKRADYIDKQMTQYEKIRMAEHSATRSLYSSAITQFFVAGLVLFIAVMGGIINFQLIALPMSEMVGGTSQIGGMRTADIAALVIILLEIAMGLFLLESLRVTHLFPIFGSMDDRMRRRIMVVALTLLTILATVEASLAYMRDLLALDREALAQSLAGINMVNAEFRWIPSIGQMILGFILPFTLAFVAIPLESFIHSLRIVLGALAIGSVRATAYVFRMLAGFFLQLAKLVINVYDAVIFLPLRVEQAVQKHRQQRYDDDEIEFVEELK